MSFLPISGNGPDIQGTLLSQASPFQVTDFEVPEPRNFSPFGDGFQMPDLFGGNFAEMLFTNGPFGGKMSDMFDTSSLLSMATTFAMPHSAGLTTATSLLTGDDPLKGLLGGGDLFKNLGLGDGKLPGLGSFAKGIF